MRASRLTSCPGFAFRTEKFNGFMSGPANIKRVDYAHSNDELMTINMGPVHPSTHGVLRLILDLDGETIVRCEPVIGYLHSGKEKLAENRTYHQFIPYTDRLDYMSPMSNNYCYVHTLEKMYGIEETERCQWLRMMLCELARISSHLLGVGSMVMDLGAITPFLYTFREREKLYDIFELISGARFTVSYMRVGGVARDADDEFLAAVKKFNDEFPEKLKEVDTLLTKNEIFIQRLKGVGVLKPEDAIDLSISGSTLRGSGVDWDIRRDNPYLKYNDVDWDVITDKGCDCYARYIVRMKEMLESVKIITQCLERLPAGPVNVDNPKVIFPPKEKVKNSMESLIHHFMLASEGMIPPVGEAMHTIEAPKGELQFYCVSDGSPRPLRTRVRTPSFYNMWAMEKISVGHLVGDMVAIIGSLDIVLGEIDR